MITLLVILLILVSLVLVITIPVALATPGEWQVTKLTFNKIFQVWVCLILVIAAADGITASM